MFHLLPGGDDVGAALVAHPGVGGLTFTGSYAVGMSIYRQFAGAYPKPVICEMGGKNPAIVSDRADLDVAADGVARSAFGLSGQKCSACSRVYAHRDVLEAFVAKLAERAASLVVGDPTSREAFLGPVISAESVERFERAVEHARSAGEVVAGGSVLRGTGAFPDGYYLAPTVVTGLAADDWILRDELFVPLVAVAPYDTLDEALALANATDLGLTAGFFSADAGEVDRFLDEIQAGVVYVNRAAGATTGAWPGVQPFGGWKGSGTGGKAGGGVYYVQQYLREQSRSVVSDKFTVRPRMFGLRAPERLSEWLDPARPVPDVRTPLPGPAGRAIIDRDLAVTSGSLPRAYPLVPRRALGSVVEDADGNLFLDCNAGIAVTSTGHCHPRGGRRR